MLDSNAMFKQYRRMIEGAAWKATKHYHIDIEETRSQVYLIFCEALERFDETKNCQFGTFLFNRLRTIFDYCSQERKNIHISLSPKDNKYNENDFDTKANINIYAIEARQYQEFTQALDRLETGLDLSEDAQEILDFIISRVWEVPGATKKLLPRFHPTMLYYTKSEGWKLARVKAAWEEIKTWWLADNHLQVI